MRQTPSKSKYSRFNKMQSQFYQNQIEARNKQTKKQKFSSGLKSNDYTTQNPNQSTSTQVKIQGVNIHYQQPPLKLAAKAKKILKLMLHWNLEVRFM